MKENTSDEPTLESFKFTSTTKYIYMEINTITLRLHYNVVHGEKTRYNGPRYIHATVVQKVFHIRKHMPHPPSFGMEHQSVYLVLWL